MPVRTAYAGAAVSGEVLTAANVNKGPGGWIGYEQITAETGSITNTEVDISGLSVGVTVGTSRRIRVTVELALASTVANDVPSLRIKEGATQLQSREEHLGSSVGSSACISASVVLTPTAGAHTYKATLVRAVGSGTLNVIASASAPAFILVEDIGPAT